MDAITAETVTQALEVGAVGWTTPEEREQILHIEGGAHVVTGEAKR